MRNGREKPWFEAPGTGKSKAGEGVGSLGFRPSFQGPALASKLAPNTDVMPHQIRKTNLSLQTISINSNSHYFGEIMRSVQFRFLPVRLTDCQIRSQALAVEWKIIRHALNFSCSTGATLQSAVRRTHRGVLGKAENHCPEHPHRHDEERARGKHQYTVVAAAYQHISAAAAGRTKMS